jgi:hypothetical protein
MKQASRFGRYVLLVALTASLAPCARAATNGDSRQAKVERSVAMSRLIAKATPDALATASLLKQFGEDNDNGSYDLAARAIELAPERRDLAWLAVRMCGRATDCDPSAPEQHLRKIDPSNGVVWFRALTHAQASDDGAAIDAALSGLGVSERVYVYFDTLVAATAPELAAAQHAGSTQPTGKELAAAAQEMVGVIAASVLPPSQALSFSCKGTALETVDRLDLCRRVAQAAEHSDTFIMEGLGLSLLQRLWPLDSVEGRAIAARRRVFQYRLEQYGRLSIANTSLNGFPIDVVEAFRAHEREQDVALAYFAKEKIAVDPPAGWISTMLPRVP